MPLELGMFLGAKHFGNGRQKHKACLILDREAYRYQRFISDIAGQDIRAHEKDPRIAISVTRDWLRNHSRRAIPGGHQIEQDYRRFNRRLPALCRKLKLQRSEMTFNDFSNIAIEWLKNEYR